MIIFSWAMNCKECRNDFHCPAKMSTNQAQSSPGRQPKSPQHSMSGDEDKQSIYKSLFDGIGWLTPTLVLKDLVFEIWLVCIFLVEFLCIFWSPLTWQRSWHDPDITFDAGHCRLSRHVNKAIHNVLGSLILYICTWVASIPSHEYADALSLPK